MYVHREARVAYLAHPRTASTATAEALQERAGFTELGGHHDGPRDHHARLSRYHDIPGPDGFEGWTVITTVRNHFAVLASWMRHWDGRSVPEGAGREWWRQWATHRAGRHFIEVREGAGAWRMFWHAPLATDVLRYRHLGSDLGSDLNAVLRREGLSPVRLPEPDRPPREPRAYREQVPEGARAWIETRFADELDAYGYAW